MNESGRGADRLLQSAQKTDSDAGRSKFLKGHAQHDKDLFFFNRTDYNRKIFEKDTKNAMSKNELTRRTEYTGWCLLSREKAVKDVNSRVGFCFLVGVQFNFDWSIFSRPIQIVINPD